MSQHKIFFICIVIIASILRLYRLGDVPISPDWDEVAHGYNAYSVLKTGMDEFKEVFPLAFKSFGEYKPPLYAYASIPFIHIFGLNEFSIRIVSALSGIFAVVGVYFLMLELLSLGYGSVIKHKGIHSVQGMHSVFFIGNTQWIALCASFLLAVSPWHIQFSRVAFESILAVTLNIWATVFFLKGLKKHILLLVSAFSFSLSMYAYHSQRIFAPIFVIFLLILWFKKIRSMHKKYIFYACSIGILILLPLLPILISSQGRERFITTSPFMKQESMLSRSLEKQKQDMQRGDQSWILFDNRRIAWVKAFLEGYSTHISLKWLFVTGDSNPRHHAPDMGLLYVAELPFFLIGLYSLLKYFNKAAALVVGWYIVSLIPASVTNELPHAGRTMILLPIPQIITAIGIYTTAANGKFQRIINGLWGKIFTVFLFCFGAVNILYYLFMYFVRMNTETAKDWQYGYKEAVYYAETVKKDYKKIVVSMNLEQPYIFFLFYTKYDPKKYLANGGTLWDVSGDVKQKFDIYEFRQIDWKNEVLDRSTLFIGKSTEMPRGNLKSITYPDGRPAIEISGLKKL